MILEASLFSSGVPLRTLTVLVTRDAFRDDKNRRGSGIRSLMTKTNMVVRVLLKRTKTVPKTLLYSRLSI